MTRLGEGESIGAESAARHGGAEGVRTPDLLNAIQALYQLSYDPIQNEAQFKVPTCLVKIILNFAAEDSVFRFVL